MIKRSPARFSQKALPYVNQMPANLPPQAHSAYTEYQEAEKIEEKIKKLKKYLSLIPKHKGTENLVEQVRKKLAKLRVQKRKQKKKSGRKTQVFTVPKELDVQLPLFGLPQTGKSRLFKVLTGANPSIGERTRRPHQGAFYFEGVGIQIVDLPPIFSGNLEETPHGKSMMGIARNADLVCLTIDLSQAISWQYETLTNAFEDAQIELKSSDAPPIKFKELKEGGIRLFGMDYVPMNPKELRELIQSIGVSNCMFEAYDKVSEEEVIEIITENMYRKPSLIVGTKADLPGSEEGMKELQEITELPVIPSSAALKKGIGKLGAEIIELLDLVRIWTEEDSKRAIVLTEGATVEDAAEKIHSSFTDLKYAKLTREGAKVEKKKVGKDFRLQDGDKLEFVLSR